MSIVPNSEGTLPVEHKLSPGMETPVNLPDILAVDQAYTISVESIFPETSSATTSANAPVPATSLPWYLTSTGEPFADDSTCLKVEQYFPETVPNSAIWKIILDSTLTDPQTGPVQILPFFGGTPCAISLHDGDQTVDNFFLVKQLPSDKSTDSTTHFWLLPFSPPQQMQPPYYPTGGQFYILSAVSSMHLTLSDNYADKPAAPVHQYGQLTNFSIWRVQPWNPLPK